MEFYRKLKNQFIHLKVSLQIIIVSFLTVAVFVLFILGFVYRTGQVFKDNNEYYTNEIVHQLEQTIYSNYNSLSQIIRFISFQTDMQEFLMEEEKDTRYSLFKQMQSNLTNVLDLNPGILDIIIADGSKLYPLTEYDYQFPVYESSSNKAQISNMLSDKRGNEFFVMYAPIYSISAIVNTNEQIGMVYLILNSNVFTEGNSNSYTTAQSKLYLTDATGNFFWSNNGADYPVIKNMEKEEYTITTLSNIGLHIISIQEREDAIYAVLDVQITYFILLAIVILALVFVWGMFISNLVQPLYRLVDFISSIKEGVLKDLNKRIYLNGYQEIEIVSREFNGMLGTIDQLTKQLFQTTSQLYEAKLLKNQAELENLRSQINPHFLYNTLESIKGIAAKARQPDIVSITKSLGLIFKYSIKGKSEVPLYDEIKIISNYISIQLYRFEGRFHAEYEIDEKYMDCIVPKMILQPLVENAIVHGIEGCDKDSVLKISASVEDEFLKIVILNGGNGIPLEKLDEIKEKLRIAPSMTGDTQKSSIGIYNVNSRIKLTCGDKYGLEIKSSLCETKVTVLLPVRL